MKPVEEVMKKDVKRIPGTTTLIEAHDMMQSAQTHHLLIIDNNGKLVSLVSDRDVRKFISPFVGSPRETPQDRATLQMHVGTIAPKSLITCKAGDDTKKCVELMLQKKIHCIPVVDDAGKALGMISSIELFRLLMSMLD